MKVGHIDFSTPLRRRVVERRLIDHGTVYFETTLFELEHRTSTGQFTRLCSTHPLLVWTIFFQSVPLSIMSHILVDLPSKIDSKNCGSVDGFSRGLNFNFASMNLRNLRPFCERTSSPKYF